VKLTRYGSLVCGLVLTVFVAGTGAAEKQTVKFGLSADYYSKYIWRGQNIDDKSVLQPTVSASAYGFTGSLWGNLDMTNKNDTSGEFSEFDWILDYTAAVPDNNWVNFSIGTIYYRFPNTPFDPTTELYAGLSLSGVPLTPSFKWYRDVDEIKGSYFQFGVGQFFEKIYVMNEKCYCGLLLGASYGWANSAYNNGYFGVDGSGSNDLTLSAALCTQIDTWMVKPNINYSTMLSNDIRQATDKSDNFWAGVGISTSF